MLFLCCCVLWTRLILGCHFFSQNCFIWKEKKINCTSYLQITWWSHVIFIASSGIKWFSVLLTFITKNQLGFNINTCYFRLKWNKKGQVSLVCSVLKNEEAHLFDNCNIAMSLGVIYLSIKRNDTQFYKLDYTSVCLPETLSLRQVRFYLNS